MTTAMPCRGVLEVQGASQEMYVHCTGVPVPTLVVARGRRRSRPHYSNVFAGGSAAWKADTHPAPRGHWPIMACDRVGLSGVEGASSRRSDRPGPSAQTLERPSGAHRPRGSSRSPRRPGPCGSGFLPDKLGAGQIRSHFYSDPSCVARRCALEPGRSGAGIAVRIACLSPARIQMPRVSPSARSARRHVLPPSKPLGWRRVFIRGGVNNAD